ncbi:hypothetical protein F442_22198 [Phytophthora nicotianae P10297]|uniref:MULE transposase domain-containing protein n=1 Tax=Phytophthora nicotianae P10297 TaxID=1317064 RepID=W2Y2T9_PHYNI|nr:hypothetical protein F442_22198 [Phytophthora nicotianae P10297]
MQCDLQVAPRCVTCDFELGLVNAVRQQFAGVPIVGCRFHWKQALRRKLIDLCIPKETRKGFRSSVAAWMSQVIVSNRTRFGYFKRTWMGTYDPALWIVNAISETTDIVNRTNNTLERFNRDLNESFS